MTEHALAICPKVPHEQQYGLRPSKTTICLDTLSPKACWFKVTYKTMSPVAISDLLMIEDTSSISPYLEKKVPM